jgi:hypothetical protein
VRGSKVIDISRHRPELRALIGSVTLLLVAFAQQRASAETKRGPARVVEVLSTIEETLEQSRYQHGTVVNPARGEYYFDCSGMAEWVLRRGAPMSLRVLGRPRGRRPLATDYHRHISRIRPGQKRGPWYRVPDAMSARPGDVVTWTRPPWFPSKSTGHVAFVVGMPSPNRRGIQGVLLRVADASRFRHEADSRGPGQTGFGTGVLLLPTDAEGQPIGYGWAGSVTPTDWLVPTKVAIGRPLL